MKKIIDKWNSLNLVLRILCGVILGAALGLLVPDVTVIRYLGTIFINTLKGIAPVLVFVIVTASISQAGEGFGAEFRNVIILYLLSTFVAAIIAVMIHFAFPLTVTLSTDAVDQSAPQSLGVVFEDILKSIVENPVSSVSNGNYLGILFWAVVIGLALKFVKGKAAIKALSDLSQGISKVVEWVIQCAPLGIFGIVFLMVASNGLSIFTQYGLLILELVCAMLFVMLVTNPLIIFICTRRNPYPLVFTCIRESAIQAFFTRSSAANIPVNMGLCKKLGLNPDFYSISIPLGSTINMDGAAVVITIMSLTLAHTMGIQVPLPRAILLALISTLAACGTSGVSGGSLLLIPMACSMLGISNDMAMQMVAVGFVISVIQDSLETALNSSADVAFTATAQMMVELRAKRRADANGNAR